MTLRSFIPHSHYSLHTTCPQNHTLFLSSFLFLRYVLSDRLFSLTSFRTESTSLPALKFRASSALRRKFSEDINVSELLLPAGLMTCARWNNANAKFPTISTYLGRTLTVDYNFTSIEQRVGSLNFRCVTNLKDRKKLLIYLYLQTFYLSFPLLFC